MNVLASKRKVTKKKAVYHEKGTRKKCCVKCKFNLGDERRCHVVAGEVDNSRGLSQYFSPKGEGMLPGDLVWIQVNKSTKLTFKEGHVISEGARGFQCRDCKYYLGGRLKCLLVRGRLKPEMSCGFIVKKGNGIELGQVPRSRD